VFYTHWLTIVNPSVSHFELSVKILLMVVLGGLGTVWGALIGAVAVQLLDDGLRGLIPVLIPDAKGEIQLIGFGVVLVLVIILMPGGLAQLWARLMSAVRQRKHPIVRGEHETRFAGGAARAPRGVAQTALPEPSTCRPGRPSSPSAASPSATAA
jgi:hypothetical protein